jgi:hypothetical protein
MSLTASQDTGQIALCFRVRTSPGAMASTRTAMGRCPNSADGTRPPFAPVTAASQSPNVTRRPPGLGVADA